MAWSPRTSGPQPWGRHRGQYELFASTSFPSLREVKNANNKIFFNPEPLPIQKLHVVYNWNSSASFVDFALSPAQLPQLQELELPSIEYTPDKLSELWETPLLQQITALTYTPHYNRREIVHELPHLNSTSLQSLKLRQDSSQPWSKTAVRREDGFTHMIFRCEWPYDMHDAYDDLRRHHLSTMPKNNALRTVEVRLHKKNRRPTQEQYDFVEQYFKTFKNLESYEIDKPAE